MKDVQNALALYASPLQQKEVMQQVQNVLDGVTSLLELEQVLQYLHVKPCIIALVMETCRERVTSSR